MQTQEEHAKKKTRERTKPRIEHPYLLSMAWWAPHSSRVPGSILHLSYCLCRVLQFSLCPCGFPPGSQVSSHLTKTCRLADSLCQISPKLTSYPRCIPGSHPVFLGQAYLLVYSESPLHLCYTLFYICNSVNSTDHAHIWQQKLAEMFQLVEGCQVSANTISYID